MPTAFRIGSPVAAVLDDRTGSVKAATLLLGDRPSSIDRTIRGGKVFDAQVPARLLSRRPSQRCPAERTWVCQPIEPTQCSGRKPRSERAQRRHDGRDRFSADRDRGRVPGRAFRGAIRAVEISTAALRGPIDADRSCAADGRPNTVRSVPRPRSRRLLDHGPLHNRLVRSMPDRMDPRHGPIAINRAVSPKPVPTFWQHARAAGNSSPSARVTTQQCGEWNGAVRILDGDGSRSWLSWRRVRSRRHRRRRADWRHQRRHGKCQFQRWCWRCGRNRATRGQDPRDREGRHDASGRGFECRQYRQEPDRRCGCDGERRCPGRKRSLVQTVSRERYDARDGGQPASSNLNGIASGQAPEVT